MKKVEYTVLGYFVGPRAAAATSVKFNTREAALKAVKFFKSVPSDSTRTAMIEEEISDQ